MRRDSFLSHPSLLLHFGLFFLTNSPSVIGEFSYNQCNHSTTYAHDSNYSHNLNTLIDELTYNVGETGYTNSSFGGNPDMVYGLLFCVGNISSQECTDCIKVAQISYSRYCWNATGARIWIRNCFLRYDNYNFISQLYTDGISWFKTRNITSNLRDFQSTKKSLLLNLSVKVYDPAKMRYAVGSDNYSTSGMVYGLVQCWGNISEHDCRTCLFTAMQSLEDTAPTSEGAQAMLANCLLRYEIYSFFNSAAESPSHERSPSPAEIHQPISKKKSYTKFLIILGITGGVLLGKVACLFTMRSPAIKSVISRRATTLMTQSQDEETGLFKKEQIVFTLETLAEATGDFHDNNKLGEGGFGPVYKGTTRAGKLIAVKKLSEGSAQGKREFINEVKLVANIQHRNLVNLLGFCVQNAQKLLVYEYLPNRSLDTFLFDSERRRELDWQKRYNIIIGIARGLVYLHEDSQLRIIHRDIKANNILLDDQMNPKIADFGLARLFPESEIQVQSRVAGTYGYMAPEYAMYGQLSVKVDVYSFGVLLLEIVSGRKNNDTNLPREEQSLSLLEWAWRLHKKGDVLSMVDSTLVDDCPAEQVLRCIHIALLCTQADAERRPLISDVITMISTVSLLLPTPLRPAFVSMTSESPNISRAPVIPSSNECSTSTLEPR